MCKVTFMLVVYALFVAVGSSVAGVADEGLVAYWALDEGSGKTVTDVTGNGHDGKFVDSPKWVEGKFGMALEFDGENDRVTIKDDDALDITKNLTLMTWFNPSDSLNGRRMMVKNNSIFVIFDFGNKDSVELLVKPNNTFVQSKTTDWKVGTWYHFAGTFDGKKMKVYINGKLENETPNNVPIAPSDLEFWIGADDLGSHFPGKIDEVRLYEKTLTEAEIQTVMDTPQVVQARGKLTTTWGKIKKSVAW